MRSIDRVRGIVRGEEVDRLPVQPMGMMFAARHAGIPFIDYTRDGRKMAEAQLRFAEDFGIDCLLTCSDPAREVIDIAGAGNGLSPFTSRASFRAIVTYAREHRPDGSVAAG
jgi:hypothetical protein